jgi:hypothetical protein
MQVSIAPIDQRIAPGTDAVFEIQAFARTATNGSSKGGNLERPGRDLS